MFKKFMNSFFKNETTPQEVEKNVRKKKKQKISKYQEIGEAFPEFFKGSLPDLNEEDKFEKLKEDLTKLQEELEKRTKEISQLKMRNSIADGRMSNLEEKFGKVAFKVEQLEFNSDNKHSRVKRKLYDSSDSDYVGNLNSHKK